MLLVRDWPSTDNNTRLFWSDDRGILGSEQELNESKNFVISRFYSHLKNTAEIIHNGEKAGLFPNRTTHGCPGRECVSNAGQTTFPHFLGVASGYGACARRVYGCSDLIHRLAGSPAFGGGASGNHWHFSLPHRQHTGNDNQQGSGHRYPVRNFLPEKPAVACRKNNGYVGKGSYLRCRRIRISL